MLKLKDDGRFETEEQKFYLGDLSLTFKVEGMLHKDDGDSIELLEDEITNLLRIIGYDIKGSGIYKRISKIEVTP